MNNSWLEELNSRHEWIWLNYGTPWLDMNMNNIHEYEYYSNIHDLIRSASEHWADGRDIQIWICINLLYMIGFIFIFTQWILIHIVSNMVPIYSSAMLISSNTALCNANFEENSWNKCIHAKKNYKNFMWSLSNHIEATQVCWIISRRD